MKYITLLILLGCSSYLPAQYTSTEIRHATGHGPYPFTINLQKTWGGNKNLLHDFIHDFDKKNATKNNTSLNGFAANLELVIASKHFLRMLGGEGLDIQRAKIGIGYRYIHRDVKHGEYRLHIQEETIGLNFGYRMNLLYPLTLEILGGPTFHSFYTVTEHLDHKFDTDSIFTRFRYGNGVFEPDPDQRKLCSGLDLKVRLNLLDPGGTEGGMGIVIEYGRMITFGDRDVSPVYNNFLYEKESTKKSWDYGYFSAGLIVPLAIRLISR